ncbi:hypothetical protein G7Y89_g2160 [Cudoniella acicularis]|uniref:Uncharacterized protein n=1 Tax=Cudoniella acicularis TaxID=354080 RepID=A0A8H4RVK5_9HELO|nr:hypothetical protein G7Y89_g2160 [Cudoniella acicularis]
MTGSGKFRILFNHFPKAASEIRDSWQWQDGGFRTSRGQIPTNSKRLRLEWHITPRTSQVLPLYGELPVADCRPARSKNASKPSLELPTSLSTPTLSPGYPLRKQSSIAGWAKFPVVADFRRLAEDAISSSFENTKSVRVCCDVTEATASALSLLVNIDNEAAPTQERRYNIGNTVITCDIGGSTTDTAVSTVSSAGRLHTWPQLESVSTGTVTIEKAFWLHAREILQSAGVSDPDLVALEVTRSWRFRDTYVKFANHRSDQPLRVEIKLPADFHLLAGVFESFYTDFVEQIEEAIDEAVNKLAEKRKYPTVIGLCGGGSRILEMATVIGNSLMWDQSRLKEFTSVTSFAIETREGIEWRRSEANLKPSTFAGAYKWFVSFTCSKNGDRSTHKIIAVPSNSALPNKFSDDLGFYKLGRSRGPQK